MYHVQALFIKVQELTYWNNWIHTLSWTQIKKFALTPNMCLFKLYYLRTQSKHYQQKLEHTGREKNSKIAQIANCDIIWLETWTRNTFTHQTVSIIFYEISCLYQRVAQMLKTCPNQQQSSWLVSLCCYSGSLLDHPMIVLQIQCENWLAAPMTSPTNHPNPQRRNTHTFRGAHIRICTFPLYCSSSEPEVKTWSN